MFSSADRWIQVNSSQRDLLEELLYHRIETLWAPFTDALHVFDEIGPDQPHCARGGGVTRGDVCYGMLRAAACVDEWDHHALAKWVLLCYISTDAAVV